MVFFSLSERGYALFQAIVSTGYSLKEKRKRAHTYSHTQKNTSPHIEFISSMSNLKKCDFFSS